MPSGRRTRHCHAPRAAASALDDSERVRAFPCSHAACAPDSIRGLRSGRSSAPTSTCSTRPQRLTVRCATWSRYGMRRLSRTSSAACIRPAASARKRTTSADAGLLRNSTTSLLSGPAAGSSRTAITRWRCSPTAVPPALRRRLNPPDTQIRWEADLPGPSRERR